MRRIEKVRTCREKRSACLSKRQCICTEKHFEKQTSDKNIFLSDFRQWILGLWAKTFGQGCQDCFLRGQRNWSLFFVEQGYFHQFLHFERQLFARIMKIAFMGMFWWFFKKFQFKLAGLGERNRSTERKVFHRKTWIKKKIIKKNNNQEQRQIEQ